MSKDDSRKTPGASLEYSPLSFLPSSPISQNKEKVSLSLASGTQCEENLTKVENEQQLSQQPKNPRTLSRSEPLRASELTEQVNIDKTREEIPSPLRGYTHNSHGVIRRLAAALREYFWQNYWLPMISMVRSMKAFIAQELYMPLSMVPEDNIQVVEFEIQTFIENFLQFLILTLVVCFDMFLSIFTILPLRVLVGIFRGFFTGCKTITRR